MRIEFDPDKNARNIAERYINFRTAAEFDWSNADIVEDNRKAYPVRRFVAIGYIGHRLHVLCFTPIEGGIRVISLRKANSREGKRYGKPLTID